MENIDVQATVELLIAIVIVIGLVKTFFKRTSAVPGETTVEAAPYKVETPAPAPVAETVDVVVTEVTEAPAPAKPKRAPAKKAPAKKPAAKKTVAKKKA